MILRKKKTHSGNSCSNLNWTYWKKGVLEWFPLQCQAHTIMVTLMINIFQLCLWFSWRVQLWCIFFSLIAPAGKMTEYDWPRRSHAFNREGSFECLPRFILNTLILECSNVTSRFRNDGNIFIINRVKTILNN